MKREDFGRYEIVTKLRQDIHNTIKEELKL